MSRPRDYCALKCSEHMNNWEMSVHLLFLGEGGDEEVDLSGPFPVRNTSWDDSFGRRIGHLKEEGMKPRILLTHLICEANQSQSKPFRAWTLNKQIRNRSTFESDWLLYSLKTKMVKEVYSLFPTRHLPSNWHVNVCLFCKVELIELR